MKLLKLSLIAAAAALVIVSSPVARATTITNYVDHDPNPDVVDGKYFFHSTDGPGTTSLDGSWVVFKSDIITDWWLNNSSVPPGGYFWQPSTLPLTPLNSHHSADPNGWHGTFDINEWYFSIESNNLGTYGYDQFTGGNNLDGSPPGVGDLYSGWGDPTGVWTLRPASVPDAGGTFQLFVCAVTALGTCKYFWRVRASARR